MYESFFHLDSRPFATAPDADHYYPAASIDSARQSLVRCLTRGEGAALVIGATGLGKSLLCRRLARELSPSARVVELLGGAVTSRRGLFQAILHALELPYRLEEAELRLTLADYVQHGQSLANGLVLLIDEAQALSLAVLEELRLLTNLGGNGRSAVRIALFGPAELEERFTHPKLESFSQRISTRCYLQPFEKTETRGYVGKRIADCGGSAESIFTADAVDQIHQATGGVPRMINQVCDHAMLLAFAGGKRKIGAAGIDEAWSDIQQLPAAAPRAEQPPGEAASTIEFGTLDDTLDESMTPQGALPPDTDIDAARQLERIQAHLGKLEREFSTAAQANPQAAPFAEPPEIAFEEEVLVDPYAALDAKHRHAAAPFQAAASQAQRAAAPPKRDPRPAGSDWPAVELPPDRAKIAPPPGANQETAPRSSPADRSRAEPTNPPGIDLDAGLGAFAGDDDLIVVDEDVPTLPIDSGPHRPIARRQEYRQLFARLRQG